MSIDQTGPGRPLNGTESAVTPPVGVGTPDTRYDDLVARLRDATFGADAATLRRYAEHLDANHFYLSVRLLRVVADVIA